MVIENQIINLLNLCQKRTTRQQIQSRNVREEKFFLDH
jgi:hypothetical protein